MDKGVKQAPVKLNNISETFNPPPAPLNLSPDQPETINSLYDSLSHYHLERRVTFQLPRTHINRDSTAWRCSPRARSAAAQRQRENTKSYCRRLNRPLTGRLLKRGVLDGSIPSAVSKTGVTSSAGLSSNSAFFCAAGQLSTKVFHVAIGNSAPVSEVRLLQQPLRDPAQTIDMVPSLRGASLLSTSKLADAGYVTVYDGDEVNVYNGRTGCVHVSKSAVLQGWQCPHEHLWCIPLTSTMAARPC